MRARVRDGEGERLQSHRARGQIDLAEIAILCAVEAAVTIVAVVDASATTGNFSASR